MFPTPRRTAAPRSGRGPARGRAVGIGVAVLVLVVGCGPSASGPSGSNTGDAAAGSSLGWQDTLTGGPDKLDVATTVAPISSIARNIGGDRIRLRGIIPDATIGGASAGDGQWLQSPLRSSS